jgi:competence protein ComEC
MHVVAGYRFDAAAVRTYPVAFFLFGLSWACLQAQWALDDRLPSRLDGETRWVEGRVVGLPQHTEAVVRFDWPTRGRATAPCRHSCAWPGMADRQ